MKIGQVTVVVLTRDVVIYLLKAVQFNSTSIEICLTDAGLDGETGTYGDWHDAIRGVLNADDRYTLCQHCGTVPNMENLTGLVGFLRPR